MRFSGIIAAFAVLAGSTGVAQAACSVAHLAGSWNIEADKVVCTVVQINTMGKASTRCYDWVGKPSTVGFSFGVDASCKLTGIADVDGRRFSVVGRLEQTTAAERPGLMIGRLQDANGNWQMTGFRN